LPVSCPPIAGDQEWIIPDEWLGRNPVELRLTPSFGNQQGLTEALILPPRALRIEIIFRRVMLTLNGDKCRRLQVEIRVPTSLQPPRAIQINWRPYDSGVTPESYYVEWAPGATSTSVTLDKISLRGDRVIVQFETEPGSDCEFAWFGADETGYGITPPDVLLATGSGNAFSQFEYVHRNTFPDGEIAGILSDDGPLPSIPSLVEAPASSGPASWPTTLLRNYRSLAADRALWDELRQLFGPATADVSEFARVPQVYQQYSQEPELRAIARRCGVDQSPFIVEQLRKAWIDRPGLTEVEGLAHHWLTAADGELDRWLRAVAAGASVERLRLFWFLRRWTCEPQEALLASRQLEQNAEQPLAALVSEMVPGSFLATELNRAVEAEKRLENTTAAPADFAQAAIQRQTVLVAIADRWGQLLPADAEERVYKIKTLLCSRPASAARELALLRERPGPVGLRFGPWPVFVTERELAARDIRRQFEQEQRTRIIADWCRALLEHRIAPAWPWLGLLPHGQTTASVLSLWHTIQPQLPQGPWDTANFRGCLRDTIQHLNEIVDDLSDPNVRALVAGLQENCDAICTWAR
jgi:hypothetical protein